MRINDLQQIQAELGYDFHDAELLRLALTHRSAALSAGRHNERLEFFGDAVVGMVVAEYLCDHFPEADEGALTKMRAAAVSRETFARVLRTRHWEKFIVCQLDPSLKTFPDSVYANIFEAVVAAVYYDAGRDLETAKRLIFNLLKSELTDFAAQKMPRNPKAVLQEWAQAQGGDIVYREIAKRGADHKPVFIMAAFFQENKLAEGAGRSKKNAEREAAEKALATLKIVY